MEMIDQAFDKKNFNEEIPPQDDFFQFANGGWMKQNEIPAEYPNWNTFLELHTKNQERLKEILQTLQSQKGNQDQTKEESMVAAFYSALMDEDAIESAGTSPLDPIFSLCKLARDPAQRAESLAILDAQYGISAFFGIYASPDKKNANHSICQVSQGGLGLPDRDYYFDEDKQEKRDLYKEHIATMFKLLDANLSEESAKTLAQRVFALELDLAGSHMTKTEKRDPIATYNKMSIEEMSETLCAGKFNFNQYFKTIGKEQQDVGDVNVSHKKAIVYTISVIESANPDNIEDYLRWKVLNQSAQYLSKAFVQEDFNFFQKTLSGTKELKPRWKRAMAFTESALGDALGKIYCAKYFDQNCKEKALVIVENVRKSLEERLKEVNWITCQQTREAALQKMAAFTVKIGYPDKWIDYSSIDFGEKGNNAPLSVQLSAIQKFKHQKMLNEINAPTDRQKWFMTPQTINAYYHPSLNEIVFPAAILQPPFFNVDADDAVNYGAMGAIVGHEMTHGFDDQGRKYNCEGNLVDWWTKDDAEEYEKRVSVMVEQANTFEVEGQFVQGKLTCGENIADLGGLRLAYRALKALPEFENAPLIGGFTASQRFFLSWATAWRQNTTKERALQMLTLDPHGPNNMRCNQTVANIEEFHRAFNVQDDKKMFKSQEKRVDIW